MYEFQERSKFCEPGAIGFFFTMEVREKIWYAYREHGIFDMFIFLSIEERIEDHGRENEIWQ